MYLFLTNENIVFSYEYSDDMTEIKGIDINTMEEVIVSKEDVLIKADEICKNIIVE